MNKKWEQNLNQRRKSCRAFSNVLLVLTSLCLVDCNGGPQSSNSSFSNEGAQDNLELRLRKTNEVRVQLNSIRKALRPVEAVMNDLSKALNAKITVNENPTHRLSTVWKRLREILKESTQSLIQYSPDGSWKMNRRIALPLGRDRYECPSSEIEIIGQRIQDHDHLSVSLTDCTSPKTFPLLEVSTYPEHIEANFFPETVDRPISSDLRLSQCLLQIQQDQFYMHCDPIKIQSSSFTAKLDSLDFFSNRMGIQTYLKLAVRDKY